MNTTTTPPPEASVRDLVIKGILTTGQADAVLAALRDAAAPPRRQRGWWVEISAMSAAPGLLVTAVFSALAAGTAVDPLTRTAFVLALAATLVTVGAAWIGLALTGFALPRDLGLAAGATMALIGAQQPVGTQGSAGWAYAGTLLVAIACLGLYRVQRSLVLLAAGVIGVTVAVPEVVWDLTDGAGGAAAILLVAGAVMLAASGAGLWMHRSQPHAPTGGQP